MTPGGVLVVGDVMRDVVVRPRGPMRRGTDQRASVDVVPGGAGANQATWLARFGVPVRLAACVGRDDLDAQARYLRGCGVDPVLTAHATLPTGSLVALVDVDGERSFLTDRGANDGLCRADLPAAVMDGVGHLHLSGYALVGERTRVTALDLIEDARRAGSTTSIDPGSAGFLADLGRERVRTWIGRASLCILNADEAAMLTGTAEVDGQLNDLTTWCDLVVLKQGAEAAVAAQRDGARWWARPPRVAVVDTVGAGDAFLAAFLARWLAGEPPGPCLDSAVRAGAESVTRVGGHVPNVS